MIKTYFFYCFGVWLIGWLVGEYQMIYRKAQLGICAQLQGLPSILLQDLLPYFRIWSEWIWLHQEPWRAAFQSPAWWQPVGLRGCECRRTCSVAPRTLVSSCDRHLLSVSLQRQIQHPLWLSIWWLLPRSKWIVFLCKCMSEWIPIRSWWFYMFSIWSRVTQACLWPQ